MANQSISYLRGNCIAPFLDAAMFPAEGGYIEGRFCAPLAQLPHSPTCCLPCPATQWTYADSFNTYMTVSEWLSVLGLVLTVFMLISYCVLPVQQTRRHYLSVCLIISIMMIAIGFTIPLATQPDQCYNDITPHDMHSSMDCAWTGTFVIAGGLAAVMWIFIRALSMHLQICWDVVPGKKFFYVAQLIGWGVPAGLFTTTMTLTGVSFRFGSACAVNYTDSSADFWGPMLAFSGLAGILQLTTFGYCIHVYLQNLWSDKTTSATTASSSALPSHNGNGSKKTTHAVYRRLKKVVWLQWRGICIVCIILVDVVFFSIVFLYLDNMQHSILQNWAEAEPWLFCLVENPNNKNACLPLVGSWLVNESTTVAVLLLLSLAGVQCFLLLTRPSIFPAWSRLITSKLSPRKEFISLDAKSTIVRSNSKAALLKHRSGQFDTTYEMDTKPRGLAIDMKNNLTLSPTISSPSEAYLSPLHEYRDSPHFDGVPENMSSVFQTVHDRVIPSPSTPTSIGFGALIDRPRQQTDYFDSRRRDESNWSERRYPPNAFSFSTPRPLSRHSSFRSVSHDPPETYGRGARSFSVTGQAFEGVADPSRPESSRR